MGNLPSNPGMEKVSGRKQTEAGQQISSLAVARVLCVHLDMGVCDLGDPLPPKQQCLVPEDLGLVPTWGDLSAAVYSNTSGPRDFHMLSQVST